MIKRNAIPLLLLITCFCLETDVCAAPIFWSGNGHYYERIDNSHISWDEARSDAESRSYLGVPGHLITITSAAEQQFLADHSMFPTSIPDRYWIGGYQPSGSPEPAGNWQWITGEAWSYSNWSAGEPNNQGSEDVAHICQGGVWNDLYRNNTRYTGGYFVEYPVPSSNPRTYGVFVGGTGGGVRGDLDAENVRDALIQFQGIMASDLYPVVTTYDDYISTMDSVIDVIQPGDNLIFFYSGHGSYNNDDTESSVLHSLHAALPEIFGGTGEISHAGDEDLAFDGHFLTDDALARKLSSDPKLAEVQKLVILDSCFSGGFWGDNADDTGDLDKLSNIGLIAASKEGSFAYSYPSDKIRAGQGYFSVALMDALDELAVNDSMGFSFDELVNALEPKYSNDNYPAEGAIRGFPWHETEFIVETSDEITFSQSVSDDFDTNKNFSVVPEPSSLILLTFISAFIILSGRRKR